MYRCRFPMQRRWLSNLPRIQVDGTSMKRVPYPTYAMRTIPLGIATLGVLYFVGNEIYSEMPEHQYKDLLQDVSNRGTVVCLSSTLAMPIMMVIYRKRAYWIFRLKIQYLSALVGTAAFFQYSNQFPNTVVMDWLGPVFGIVASITVAAICAPICNDGWAMSAAWAAVTTFLATYSINSVYFDGILYEKASAKWQRQLEKAQKSQTFAT